MDLREKTSVLFDHIKELYALKFPIVCDISKQKWTLLLNKLPNNDKNYVDLKFIDDSEQNEDYTILKVKSTKPFTSCPLPPSAVSTLLDDGWDDPDKKPLIKEQAETDDSSEKSSDAADAVWASDSFKEWETKRDLWAEQIKKDKAVFALFEELRKIDAMLDRDSDTLELMAGQGMVTCITKNGKYIYHPILAKRVKIDYNDSDNAIEISDTETDVELNLRLLSLLDFTLNNNIFAIKEDIADNQYHPFDNSSTPKFLEKVAKLLDPSGVYIDSIDEKCDPEPEHLKIYNRPILFIRERSTGVLQTLDTLTEKIKDKNTKIPRPIAVTFDEPNSDVVPSDSDADTASVGKIDGGDVDVLLTKDANEEQLEIAERIEKADAIVVQGPPGTGKTHTIANLLGHFLAQGKSVLVTSHTRKALSVLKDKIDYRLQNLCVSVLEDNNDDMRSSIKGITEFLSNNPDPDKLLQKASRLRDERAQIMASLDSIRKKKYAIKNTEYKSIFFNGERFTPAAAAKFLHEHAELANIIPGAVRKGEPLPVSVAELELVYSSNSCISADEESELFGLEHFEGRLTSPEEFADVIKAKQDNQRKIESLCGKLPEGTSADSNSGIISEKNRIIFNLENSDEKFKELSKLIDENKYVLQNIQNWMYFAMASVADVDISLSPWYKLICSVSDTYQFAQENSVSLLGHTVTSTNVISYTDINILHEMKNEFVKSGKITGWFGILKVSYWKDINSSVMVDGHPLSTAEDCKLAIAYFSLKLRRQNIALLWKKFVTDNGGPSAEEFGEQIEIACREYCNKILQCLEWMQKGRNNILTNLISFGFEKDFLVDSEIYTNPSERIFNMLIFIFEKIPIYIDFVKCSLIDSRVICERLEKVESIFNMKQDAHRTPPTIGNLCSAISNEDIYGYAEYFEKVSRLLRKSENLKERTRIIDKIRMAAPVWAMSIQERSGIHGLPTVPENIFDAWKWKQLDVSLQELSSESYAGLQEKESHESQELKRVTAELVENLSWYRVVQKITADLSLKSDLVNWSTTMNKIGKGTGKNVQKYLSQAKKLMGNCQTAVPAWIMPINKALETMDCNKNHFDIVIIDESSQSDISAMAILFFAEKAIIVGDNEQVSPSAVGADNDRINQLTGNLKEILPFSYHLYDLKTSLYDIMMAFSSTTMLKEHFRCVPEIIGYSNNLCYNNRIKPLREGSRVPIKPATVVYQVDGERTKSKTNAKEAQAIAALIQACIEQPEYRDMTFGVISMLGEKQAETIERILINSIDRKDYKKHRILCGNAAHFQGDERDVMFLSFVDSNEGEGPIRIQGDGANKSTKQRYNVAVSRACNQVWAVNSLDTENDLKTGDLRKDLIEYLANPHKAMQNDIKIQKNSESDFELRVCRELSKQGYNFKQQWEAGSYRIDIVVLCEDRRIAIECDGDLYHCGEEKIREDVERQAILERLGWRFIRIRGSEFYREPVKTMESVYKELKEYEIFPEKICDAAPVGDEELLMRVKKRAAEILNSPLLEKHSIETEEEAAAQETDENTIKVSSEDQAVAKKETKKSDELGQVIKEPKKNGIPKQPKPIKKSNTRVSSPRKDNDVNSVRNNIKLNKFEVIENLNLNQEDIFVVKYDRDREELLRLIVGDNFAINVERLDSTGEKVWYVTKKRRRW